MKPIHTLPRIRISAPYICKNCLLTRTSQSTPRPSIRSYATANSPPAPPAKGYTRLLSRRLISISGPDATKYLQGVVTANVSPSTPRSTSGGFYAAFLNAKGRLLNDVFIYPDPLGLGEGEGVMGRGGGVGKWSGSGQGWLIEVDSKEVEALAKHVKKYRVSAKFDIRVVPEGERGVWSVWDEGAKEGWTAHSFSGSPATSSTPSTSAFGEGELGCMDKRAPGMGRRLLLPTDKTPEVESGESTEDAYRIRRYLKGVAEGQDELIKEHALPQESNIDFMGGVDYRKGCYVGQELTIRTHHTGVVRKRILPVMVYGNDEPIPETLEYRGVKEGVVDAGQVPAETSIGRVEKRGRSAGKWLSGIGNVGLGLCRLEIMTGVQVGGEGLGGWKEGDEFKLEWEVDGEKGDMVKVKAFVPGWHLKK